MAAAYSSRDIVEDYLQDKLVSRGVAWPCPPPGRTPRRRGTAEDVLLDPGLAPPPLQAALHTAGDKLARCYHGDLWAQVSVRLCRDGGGVVQRHSLTAVSRELFRDGVNWGRIVTMMELGGALSAEAAEAGLTCQVDDIAGWMEDSLDSPPLRGWIQDNGGWDAFLQLYESRPPVTSWSLRTVVGLVVLGAAGITLGALFSQK
ncbi:apoptosis regulator Bcl-2-like [Amphiprion ocellaris]|uniref:Apoptosis regulator Bcl-2 family BH4 domain-containing protein n=1 Tax=Amphiprion ocellaris TaxID=80972 RepID=A0AAQ6AKN6_AMPOC|nr:apoptosis regulator Bcl-2-like [Amphiprion ocellaris]